MSSDITGLSDPDFSENLWDRNYWGTHAEKVSLKFINGDTYEGKFNYSYGGKIIPANGIYTYHNGDKFIGNCSRTYGGIYINGTTVFKDGTKEQGNWLAKYRVPDNVLNKWDSDKKMCPSDVRAAAIKESEVMRAEKQKLVQKYGSRYAENIMNGVIETGMTKEMCALVLSKVVGMEFYRVSSWTNFSGDKMETWQFDYDYGIEKENQKILKEGIENNDKNAFLVYGFMNAIGELTSGAASSMAKYKYLKFRNSVLIELKDSSFYDDVNKAQRETEDALNSLYWLFGE